MTHFRVKAEEALNSETSVELYREALTSCVEESEQILRMLSTLMDISEAESGLIKDKLIETDLSSVVEEACLMYQFIADERNIVISHSTERNLIVSADPVRIGQVVNNLIDNAVKYSRPGSAVAVASRREDAHAVIVVADEGPGIPEDELPLIWNRLYRGRAGKGARGSGLGLSLAKAIVDAYGGTIKAENRASGGAVFTVRVPLSFAKE
jgi:signal transduction histidine kinase